MGTNKDGEIIMQETTNIGLKKPEGNEYINIDTLNENADKVDAEFAKVENLTFDDSGTSEGINSFTDFMNSVKSKMSIFDFFKNFKAGMKYVLHTGKLVNNATTTQEGFALDARMGKVLQDQITAQNKNINGTFYETGDLIEWANSKHETMLGSFSSACINLPSTGNFDVIRFEHGGYLASMIAIRQSDRKMFVSEYNTVAWSDWTEYVTNSDLIAQQIPATLLNGWTQPFVDNHLITYKIGNLYMLSGIIRSPSIITEDTYNVANLNLPFNFTGQGCVNSAVQSDSKLYLTSYNDGILHDQYRQTIPNTEYVIKGFFIH